MTQTRAQDPAPSSSTKVARSASSDLADDLHTVFDWWRYAVSEMNRAGTAFGQGTANATEDAAFLVLGALDLPLGELDAFARARLSRAEKARIEALLEARVRDRVPTAYLLGFTELLGVRFRVTPDVLIPRSYLAELIASESPPWLSRPPGRILDMCTGSGCLAVLAALRFPEARVTAVDLSAEALAIAQENVALHGLADRILLREGDGWSAVRGERFDLVLCNPPYVTADSMATLPPEFRHEPALALAAGEDGNAFLRVFLPALADHLTPEGVALVDVGHNRSLVEAAFPDFPFIWLETEGAEDGVFLLRRDEL